MFYALGLNFKIFLKIFPRFLSLCFVMFLDSLFPGNSMILWLFKIFIVVLEMWGWYRRIKKESRFQFFEASFICTGVYWFQTIVVIIAKHELSDGWIIYLAMFWIAGMIITAKTLNDSWKIIQKHYPHLKKNTEIHWRSPDDYFEGYSNAENLERELTEIKKEASPVVMRALLQRKAGELIVFFHLEIIYLTLLVLCCSPWMK